ncbi:MAG TPA: hypothetical protein VIU61_07165 [Kofleriaceae bacterium]
MTRGLLIACAVALGCGSDAAPKPAKPAKSAKPGQKPGKQKPGKPTQAPTQQAGKPIGKKRAVALVTDPEALAAIAAAGGAFDALVDAGDRATITRITRADIAAAGKGDPEAGVGIAGNSHRLFDAGWLDRGRYELIGLAYRIDRMPVTPETCGDVRLIYRLAYRAKTSGVEVGSRLPMTVAVVLAGPARDQAVQQAGGCQAAAAAWRVDGKLTGKALGDELAKGALAGLLGKEHVRQVLTNTQVVRWPSGARPDLAGHAEYSLRAFRRDGGKLVPAPADHSPDVAKLKDRKQRDRLLAWLRDPATLDALELGWAQLPAELTAARSISVSPRGFARRANRPFRQLVKPNELADLAFDDRKMIGSAEALLRRLDEHTCAGCHQAQTIAGFHMLGDDGPDVAPGNALASSISPPLAFERTRREAQIDALAAGKEPDFMRPAFERAGKTGQRGTRCGLGDPGFASWSCNAGLSCQATDAPLDDNAVGECLPPPERREIGDPCELGPLLPHADPRRDHGPRAVPGPCAEGACNGNRVGFPGGMCRPACDRLPADGTCGVIAVLTPFNNCLARKRPFPECLAQHVTPAGLRKCDDQNPCRDDYVCARTASGSGGCTPPYFLFQLRVDGHPPSSAAIKSIDDL